MLFGTREDLLTYRSSILRSIDDQDVYLTARHTPTRWSNRIPTVNPRWVHKANPSAGRTCRTCKTAAIAKKSNNNFSHSLFSLLKHVFYLQGDNLAKIFKKMPHFRRERERERWPYQILNVQTRPKAFFVALLWQKVNRKVQGVPQSQTVAIYKVYTDVRPEKSPFFSLESIWPYFFRVSYINSPLFRVWRISIALKLAFFLQIIFLSKLLGLSDLESVQIGWLFFPRSNSVQFCAPY